MFVILSCWFEEWLVPQQLLTSIIPQERKVSTWVPVNLSFNNKGEVETFSDKAKLKEFVTRPTTEERLGTPLLSSLFLQLQQHTHPGPGTRSPDSRRYLRTPSPTAGWAIRDASRLASPAVSAGGFCSQPLSRRNVPPWPSAVRPYRTRASAPKRSSRGGSTTRGRVFIKKLLQLETQNAKVGLKEKLPERGKFWRNIGGDSDIY